jgi:CheY-like chemotaxis protein
MSVPLLSWPDERSAYSAFFRAVNDDIFALSERSAARHQILCECSRQDCSSTLLLTAEMYHAVRRHPRRFVVAAGHESAGGGQRVVTRHGAFSVIEQRDELAEFQPRESPLASDRSRPLVLVADDEPAIRELCSACLQLSDIAVIEAPDGRQALDQAMSLAPDLLITDVSMPVMDGFLLATALRADARTARIPIIFLSGETSDESEAHGMSLGALAYLKKPFDPDRLAAIATGIVARFAHREPLVDASAVSTV